MSNEDISPEFTKPNGLLTLVLPIQSEPPIPSIPSVSYLHTAKEMALLTLPYLGYVIVFSMDFESFILRYIKDDDAIAAMPSISMLIFTMGLTRGMIEAVNLQVGKFDGAGEYRKVGEIVRLACVMSAGLSIPTMLFMSHVEKLLLLFNTQPDIARKAGEFYDGFRFAVPAILLLTCAQQLALGVGHSATSAIIGSGYALLPPLFEYILVADTFGLNLGMFGLGLGSAIGASMTVLMSGIYFWKAESYQKYRLFCLEPTNIRHHFSAFFKTGGALALRNLSESFSMMPITIVIDRYKETAYAAQAFSPLVKLENGLASSIALIVGSRVANTTGGAEKNTSHFNMLRAAILSKQFGHVSIVGIVGITTVISLFYFVPPFPHLIEELTLDFSQFNATNLSADDYPSDGNYDYIDQSLTIELANKVGMVLGASAIADGARTVAMGALSGYGDIMWPTLISFLLMTVMVVPLIILTMFFMEDEDINDTYLFYLFRGIGAAISALILGCRWVQSSEQFVEKVTAPDEVSFIELAEFDSSSTEDEEDSSDHDSDDGSDSSSETLVSHLTNAVGFLVNIGNRQKEDENQWQNSDDTDIEQLRI